MTVQPDTLQGHGLMIGHLKIRCGNAAAARDILALRLRVERALDRVDLEPPGLPRGAVLVVRELRSAPPLPGAEDAAGQWSASARDRLAELYHTAARPMTGGPAPNAASALFADWSELLACLTRDLVADRAWRHWYWQQVLRGTPRAAGPALAAMWSSHADALPGALALLARHEAVASVRLLTRAEVAQVIAALRARFDLAPLSRAAADTFSGSPDAPTPAQENPGRVVPPWASWLPDDVSGPMTDPALTPAAEYLLGLGLALYHAPAFARSAMFAAQAAAWLSAEHPRPQLEPIEQTMASRPAEVNTPQMVRGGRETEPSQEQFPGRMIMRGTAPQPMKTSRQVEESGANSFGPFSDQLPVPDAAPRPTEKQLASSMVDRPSSLSGQRDTSPAFELTTGSLLAPDGLPTFLGGALYLVNLLGWLGLPGDDAGCVWDEPTSFAVGLGGWATVEALTRGLLGGSHARHAGDPLWAALAFLDGRGLGAPVGAALLQPTAFRLPAAWLRRSGPAASQWLAATAGRRVRLFDPVADYVVADLPWPRGDPARIVKAAVAEYRAVGVAATWRWAPGAKGDLSPFDKPRADAHAGRGTTAGENGSPPRHKDTKSTTNGRGFVSFVPWSLYGERAIFRAGSARGGEHVSPFLLLKGRQPQAARSLIARQGKPYLEPEVAAALAPPAAWWLARVRGFIAYLLSRALDKSLDASESLICRPGMLVVSHTHVDLSLPLDAIDIAIRRCGLDRDPGWAPDLGRIVYFHFV